LQNYFDSNEISIISVALHPGLVATGGGLDLFPYWLKPILRRLGKTPLQGASSALFAATMPEVKEKENIYKGAYLGPRAKMSLLSDAGQDAKLAKDLWVLTEKVNHRPINTTFIFV
jgi:hypothetical protein